MSQSGIGLGSEVKERGSVIHARITDTEYELLRNISLMGTNGSDPTRVNISEGVRFCINFTAKVLSLLPDVLMETVIEEYEKKVEKLKKLR